MTHDKGKESSVVFVERKERASFRDKQGVIAPLIDGDIVDRGSDMSKCCVVVVVAVEKVSLYEF